MIPNSDSSIAYLCAVLGGFLMLSSTLLLTDQWLRANIVNLLAYF
mgnify:CR=1 FL=1